MYPYNNYLDFLSKSNQTPAASAKIKGSDKYPAIKGTVEFFSIKEGVLVVTDIVGLPVSKDKCSDSIFAFHVHEGNSCSGNEKDPFSNALKNYNPSNCPHPYHLGDLPPLFSANGRAFSMVLTSRFKIDEVIGKTIIIHSAVDDFTSQSSGNAGAKIACGEIARI